MSDRRDFSAPGTERPERRAPSLLRVADVLALPVMRDGAPRVLVGGAALDAGVRWVHASDSAGVARLLDGGELLLTTAAAWPRDARSLRALVRELAAVGVAGLVVELGDRMPRVPDAVVDACAEAALALVALGAEVKFVTVTEAVHRALIDAQTTALRERQELHELFTALSLRGAPADVIVTETSRALGAPVVLENLAGEVIAVEPLTLPVAAVLDRLPAPASERVPVQARGVRWGSLTALDGPAHPAGRLTVLELGATALAFGCLADGEAEWTLLAHRSLIDDLLGSRFARIEDVVARLRRLGLDLGERDACAVVVRTAEPVDRIRARAAGEGVAALAARRDGVVVLLLSPPRGPLTDAAARRIAGTGVPVVVGPSAEDVPGLLASARTALDLAARSTDDTGEAVRRAADRPLEQLVAALGDDRRLQEHGERMLAPLIRHDRERRGDLLDVLGALVAHPGNRSAAAAASHLSRSVFYQRIALIADLLDADLDDGEVLAALHIALLSRPRSVAGRP